MLRRFALLTAGLCALAACGEEGSFAPPQPLPHSAGQAGRFTLSLSRDAVLSIAANDRDLLAGLLPRAGSPTGPPLTGFAARNAGWSYQTQLGSFLVSDAPDDLTRVDDDWRVATEAEPDGSGLAFRLLGDEKPLASITFSAPDDEAHLTIELRPLDPSARRVSFGFRCEPGERFVGFGSQSWDVDQRGQTVPVFVSEQGIGKSGTDGGEGFPLTGPRHSAQWAQPWALSSRGYVLVAESDRYVRFALCSETDGVARVEAELPLVLHLFDGPNPAFAVGRATATFGRPRQPPLFAFAPWSDAIKGRDRVLAEAAALRASDVPASAIWTEDWKGGTQQGAAYSLSEEWEVDRALYPDFAGMASQLHAQGFKFFAYFNPFVYEDTLAYQETAPRGLLVKAPGGAPYSLLGAKLRPTGLLDVTNDEAVAWAIGKMDALMNEGVDGWMHDFGEWLPTDAELAGGAGLDLHNRYPVLWQKAARAAIDGRGDGVERLFFSRSGWLGTPPLVDVFWAGDQETTFAADDGLPTVPVIGINLSAQGCPAFGHDVGGYTSLFADPTSRELFFRWVELGAFSPVMRTHHGQRADENWRWNRDPETIEHFRRYALEHIRLAPYFAALAAEAETTGVPILRGLFLEHPDFDPSWTLRDEFLLGPGLLVAPVLAAGSTSRLVTLPPGTWFDWSADETYEGGGLFEAAAPLEEVPAFLRAGSLVVRYPERIRTLALSSPAVPGPAEVGDDRDLVVALGGDATLNEAGATNASLRYTLRNDGPSPGPLAYRYRGAEIGDCPAEGGGAPCVASRGKTRDELRLAGPGKLEALSGGKPTAALAIEGGVETRALNVVVRHLPGP